jgi:cytochrome c oxidase subunit 2
MRISFSEVGNFLMFGLVKFHDFLFFFLLLIFIFVMSMMVIVISNYVIGGFNKYDRERIEARKGILKQSRLTHFPSLEFFWTVFPSFILVNMALPTFTLLYVMDLVVDPVFTIKAIGNQWYWSYESNDFPWKTPAIAFDSFILDETQLEIGDLRLLEVDNFFILPADMEMRLLVTSRDVLHSFAIPSLGIKVDAIPGRLNQIPLSIQIPGLYFGQCSELCGPNHGFMPIQIYVKK